MDQSNSQRRVAVLVETEDSWGSGVVRGIADYSQDYGYWNLLIDPRDHEQRIALPDLWEGHGIIARIGSRIQLNQIQNRKLPTVNVDTVFEDLDGIYDVVTDDKRRAEMAFSHLRDRGFEEFGYFAPPSKKYSPKRGDCFQQVVEKAGFNCRIYKPGYRVGRKIGWKSSSAA